VVANSPIFGGGIPICPPADPTDCKLDFLTVKSMRKLAIIFAFLKLKKGKVMKFKQTVHQPVTEIKISSSNTNVVNVDGELYNDIPFEVKIVSNTLKLYR
jgi:diacylglycerol kinase (ATP)